MRWTQEQWMALMTLLGVAVAMAALCVMTPGNSQWLPPCPFYKLTGLYCPGCGSTRMLYYLMHGHPMLAMRENVLAMVTLPSCVFVLSRQLTRKGFRNPAPAWWGRAVLAGVVLFTLARNVPTPPFSRLAPPAEGKAARSAMQFVRAKGWPELEAMRSDD